jgi:hypothetical protein
MKSKPKPKPKPRESAERKEMREILIKGTKK